MTAKATIRKAATKVAGADAAVTEALDEHRHSPAVELISTASEIADQPQLRLIGGLVVAAGLLGRKPRLARAGVRMLLSLEVATAAKDFIKRRVDRTRPRSARTRSQAKAKPGRNTAKEVTSFPSGHTAGAVAVAQAFAREFPEHRAPALTAAGAVALAQIPRCAHYPTDVGAGALIGAAAEALVAWAWPAQPDNTDDDESDWAEYAPPQAP